MFDLSRLGTVTDIFSGITLDGTALRAQIAGRFERLASCGVGKGDHVLIAHGGTTAFFVDLLAVWLRGGVAICVNPGVTANELSCLADFSKPVLLIAGNGTTAPSGLSQIEPGGSETADGDSVAITLPFTADDKVLVLFTSGTTGDPKGVVHTAGSLFRRVTENIRIIGHDVLENTLCVLPTHFGHGLIGNSLTPLMAGQHLHLFVNPGLPGIASLSKVLDDHKITFMSSVPSFWKVALKAAEPPTCRTLKRVQVGSAPLSSLLWMDIMKWSGAQVCNLYGITETANWAAGACSGDFAPEDGLVGRMWGGSAAVKTMRGEISDTGEGEILLRTPGMMAGYLFRDDLTSTAMRDGWYHTGDWGTIDEGGVIRLSGRIKSEINRAGMKVLPEELDLLMERHPSVLEACAFGVPDPLLGEAVGIAVRLAEQAPTVKELREWCAERIRSECVPERWFVVSEIPKTDRGKLNRDRVRNFCMEKPA